MKSIDEALKAIEHVTPIACARNIIANRHEYDGYGETTGDDPVLVSCHVQMVKLAHALADAHVTLAEVLKHAPTSEPVEQLGGNYDDAMFFASEQEHWRIAEIVRPTVEKIGD